MKEHLNFYEDIAEATKRLTGTVVKYDGDFYYVLLISNHKTDGIFRIYLDPVEVMESRRVGTLPYLGAGAESGKAMDQWLTDNPTSRIIRKMMNSPMFDKFRPFPLGMINRDGYAVFTERSPTRHTQQGLTSQMISGTLLDVLGGKRWGAEATGDYMLQAYRGTYPSYEECFVNMTDPTCQNTGAAFSRTMAILRGPCDTVFLNYRGEVIGQILGDDGKTVKLGRRFKFTKEVVQAAGVFNNVAVTE